MAKGMDRDKCKNSRREKHKNRKFDAPQLRRKRRLTKA